MDLKLISAVARARQLNCLKNQGLHLIRRLYWEFSIFWFVAVLKVLPGEKKKVSFDLKKKREKVS